MAETWTDEALVKDHTFYCETARSSEYPEEALKLAELYRLARIGLAAEAAKQILLSMYADDFTDQEWAAWTEFVGHPAWAR